MDPTTPPPRAQVKGLVLLKHGLFTFADTAKEAYELHVGAVEAAAQPVAAQQPDEPRSSRPFPRSASPRRPSRRMSRGAHVPSPGAR